jgi:hypothetical protein
VLDLNRDGQADLIVANALDDTVSLLLGLGGGSFAEAIHFPVGATPRAIVSDDVNLDGLPDVIVANTIDNTISLLRGVRIGGSVSLSAAITVAADVGTAALAVADVNRDGRPDLITLDRRFGQVSVLDGSRGWQALQLLTRVTTAAEPVALAAGDLNRDGRVDLVTASRTTGVVSVLLGDGRGGFSPRVDYSAGRTPASVCIADATGNGRFDVVVANEQVDTVTVLAGDGSGRLVSTVTYRVGGAPLRALVDDISGDRVADILAVNSFSDTVSALLGRREGGFATALDFSVGTTPFDLAVTDVNDDGKPDVVTVNFDDNNLSLLLNTSDHVVLPGDVDANGRLDAADIRLIIAELFDGDGDSPIATPRGFVATGTAANANRDARISVADVVGVLVLRRR